MYNFIMPSFNIYLLYDYVSTRILVATSMFCIIKYIIPLLVYWGDRDCVHFLTLPRVKGLKLWPFQAFRQVLSLYCPESNEPLFQYKIGFT